jgi:hypothetical protein
MMIGGCVKLLEPFSWRRSKRLRALVLVEVQRSAKQILNSIDLMFVKTIKSNT